MSSFGCDCFVPLNAFASTHTLRNTHNQEANSCVPGLGMQIIICNYGIHCKHPPSLPATSIPTLTNLHHMHHMLHVLAGRGSQGLLGSPFKQIKTASDAAHLQSLLPAMPRTGNKPFFSACLCMLLHWRYKNKIQPFQGNRASLE